MVGIDHSGNKSPGKKPQSEWACDVGVDQTIFAFTSSNGFDWSLKGEVSGANKGGESGISCLKHHNGTYYAWVHQAEPNMKQGAGKGSNYKSLSWQGWINELNFGHSEVEAFIHDDNNTVTLVYWPFGGGHSGNGNTVWFATSSLSNMTAVSNKRKVRDGLGSWSEWRHSIIKDVEAGEWKWYYGSAGKVDLRTAPLNGSNPPPDPDLTPPSIASISAGGDPNQVMVSFSEQVEQSSAENASFYSITGGISVYSSSLQADKTSIALSTSTMSGGTTCSLDVIGVQDLSGNIADDRKDFTYAKTPSPSPSPSPSGDNIIITGDDAYEIWVNGTSLGTNSSWNQATTYELELSAGDVVAVKGMDPDGYKAGILAEITVDGQRLGTGTNWKASLSVSSGWQNPGYDANGWSSSIDYGGYGTAPWDTKVNGMPTNTPARWIWSGNNPGDTPVYFRYTNSVNPLHDHGITVQY